MTTPTVDNAGDRKPSELLTPNVSLWATLAERVGAGDMPATDSRQWEWSEPEWEEVGPGIECQVLSVDTDRDHLTLLVRLAPGTDYPPHTHAGVEELHLLQGELWIDDRKLYPGDYYRGEPGTSDHRVWSETGCTGVLMTSARDILT